MRLRDIAHARTGDKGDTSNIAVVAYRAEDFVRLRALVTAERVKAHFGAAVRGPVQCYALPALGALNVVLEGALGGGVTRSLALDPHGKSLSSSLLDMEIGDSDGMNGAGAAET